MATKAQLAAQRAAAVAGYELHTDRPDLGLQIWVKDSPCNDGEVLGKCFYGRAAKPAWFYRLTPEQLEGKADREVKAREQAATEKAAQKVCVAGSGVKVGDVFKSEWGYNQTNVDYYQVTRMVGKQSVELRRIGAISWDTLHMQGRSVPDVDNFIGRPMVKRLRLSVHDGTASVAISSFEFAYQMAPVIDGVPVYESSAWTSYA